MFVLLLFYFKRLSKTVTILNNTSISVVVVVDFVCVFFYVEQQFQASNIFLRQVFLCVKLPEKYVTANQSSMKDRFERRW